MTNQHADLVGRRRDVLRLTIATVWTILAPSNASAMGTKSFRPPVEFPFDIHSVGSVIDVALLIDQHRIYAIDLAFGFTTPDERKRVFTLVGGAVSEEFTKPGVVVPVRLLIANETNSSGDQRQVLDRVFETRSRKSHEAAAVVRPITAVNLTPGKYSFRAEAIRVVQEFENVTTSLRIGWHPNTRPLS